jgi:hypothetical protein
VIPPKKKCSLALYVIRIGYVSLSSFWLSLAFPSFYTKYNTLVDIEPAPTIYGFEAFLLGWTVIFSKQDDYQSFAWLANITFLGGLVFFMNRKIKTSILFSTISILLGLHAFSLTKIWNDKEPPTRFVENIGLGFYVWEFSFFILFFGAILLMVFQYLKSNR